MRLNDSKTYWGRQAAWMTLALCLATPLVPAQAQPLDSHSQPALLARQDSTANKQVPHTEKILGVMRLDTQGRWSINNRRQINKSHGYSAQKEHKNQVIRDWRKLLDSRVVSELNDEEKQVLLADPFRLASSRMATKIFSVPRLLLIYPQNGDVFEALQFDIPSCSYEYLELPQGTKESEATELFVEKCLKGFEYKDAIELGWAPDNYDRDAYYEPAPTASAYGEPDRTLASSEAAPVTHSPASRMETELELYAQVARETSLASSSHNGQNQASLDVPDESDNGTSLEDKLNTYRQMLETYRNHKFENVQQSYSGELERKLNDISLDLSQLDRLAGVNVCFRVKDLKRYNLPPYAEYTDEGVEVVIPTDFAQRLDNRARRITFVAGQLARARLGYLEHIPQGSQGNFLDVALGIADAPTNYAAHVLNLEAYLTQKASSSTLQELERNADREAMVLSYLYDVSPQAFTRTLASFHHMAMEHLEEGYVRAQSFSQYWNDDLDYLKETAQRLNILNAAIDTLSLAGETQMALYLFDNAYDVLDQEYDTDEFIRAYFKLHLP